MMLSPQLKPAPVTVAFIGVLLSACSSTKSNLPPLPITPEPNSGVVASLPPYKVQVGDVLDVKLFLNPELNDEVTVRPDGMISTAVAHDIAAYNRTPMEITEALKESYKANLTNPQISVIVHSFAPNRVYVAGEVNAPGEV